MKEMHGKWGNLFWKLKTYNINCQSGFSILKYKRNMMNLSLSLPTRKFILFDLKYSIISLILYKRFFLTYLTIPLLLFYTSFLCNLYLIIPRNIIFIFLCLLLVCYYNFYSILIQKSSLSLLNFIPDSFSPIPAIGYHHGYIYFLHCC